MRKGGTSTGKRSPRWAFMEPFLVSGSDGSPYLYRRRIIQTPRFGLYYHRIFRADADPDPHDHPWAFASLVICGGYEELVWPDKTARGHSGTTIARHRLRWSLRALGQDSAHMITTVHGTLRTLVVTGPRRSSWGFWTPEGFTRWQDYVQDTGACPGGDPW